jgi:outer membrane lipoprotein-sorting protein
VEPELGPQQSNDKVIVPLPIRSLLLCSYLLFLLLGCARELPTFEPADMPASVVVEHLEKRKEEFRSFRAVGSIQLQGEKQRWSGRAFFLSQLPGSLRLEILSFFGQPVLYAASDGYEFMIWEPGHNRAFQGLAAQGTLARLIKFPLHDQEALLVLAGVVPTWDQAEKKLFKLPDNGTMLLQFEDGSSRLTQRVWLEGESLIATRMERRRGGDLELEATFSDFLDIEGWLYPKHITIKGAKTRVTINYEQITINESLDHNVFQLNLPEGVEIIPW